MAYDSGNVRVVTIVVPKTVKEEFIGDYVSDKITAVITDIGSAQIIRKTQRLVVINERLYALIMETASSYTLPPGLNIHEEGKEKEVDTQRPNASEHSTVAEDQVASRNKEGLGSLFRTGAAKR